LSRLDRIRAGHSTRARFVLLCLVLTVASTVPILFFVYLQTDRIVVDVFKQRVHDRQAILMRDYRTGGIAEVSRSIRERVTSGATGYGAILLVDPAGRKIEGNIAAWPPTLRGPTKWAEMRLYREGHAESEMFALDTIDFPSGHRLLVGTLFDDRARMRRALFIALAGALFLAVPIGLAGSLVLLRFMNKRVTAIGDVAARIAAGDLSRRVAAGGTTDPFDRLGASLNAMLARIEALVEELRLVTDALAHDLRSPLMRMRAWIEKAGDEPRTQSQPAFDAITHEIEGILRMIAGTLEISRTEAGMGRDNFAAFDLGALTRDLCEMYHPLAEEKGVSIAVEKPRSVAFFGNREMIGQAVSNLIDNGLKYGADGGSIQIGLDEDEDFVRLWVADRGAGINADRRQEAVRKYGRLDPARSTDGSGLGLALVSAVARLHGGALLLEDEGPGLRAILSFPRNGAAGAADRPL
jgi:signal transduction histidine kinase